MWLGSGSRIVVLSLIRALEGEYGSPLYGAQALSTMNTVLGSRYDGLYGLIATESASFHSITRFVEALYLVADNHYESVINANLRQVFLLTELDIGIQWKEGHFERKGAEMLDEGTINDNLRWMRREGMLTIYEPFAKGLRHILDAKQRPELFQDAVTDFYEALESMVKLFLENDRELSRNKQSFISKLNGSKSFKDMLRALLDGYVSFGCSFRHGEGESPKRSISEAECEAFMYQSGILIRYALLSMDNDLRGGDGGGS